MIILREKERIILIKRRHPLILLRNISLVALIFFTIIILMFVLFFSSFSFPESLVDTFPVLLDYRARIFTLYLLSVSLLFLWQTVFIILADYYLDCWIVTDQRTIHTEIKSLFNRTFSSISHDRIQDVTVNVKGIIPTFLKYGDLQIQTAGGFQEFIFKQIPDPYQTKEEIFKAQKDYSKEKGRNQ